jgi:WD40 repeat protein
MRTLLRSLLPLAALAVAAPAFSQSACSHRLLVSGYNSNVHIYDACSGAFERTLDPQAGRLQGAQAIRLGPDGALWVVSEITSEVHRYDAVDFHYIDTPIDVGAGFGITGLTFRGEQAYVGGYNGNTVRTYSLSGQLQGTPVQGNTGVRGFDNGLTFGPDGSLYIPGYDTHNLLRHDPASGQNTLLVAASSGGLRNTRGILFRPDGETFLVSSEGSGQVLEYRRSDGGFVRQLASTLPRATGMAWAPDGALTVVTGQGVVLLDPDTGARRSTLVSAGSGGLNGPTFALYVAKPASIDTAQIGTQFWLTGPGRLVGRTLLVDALYSATGAAFGADFDPADIAVKRWGSLEIEFTGCGAASMNWTSTGAASAGFGDGGYALTRFLPGPGTRRCELAGFAQSPAEDWLQGTWSGGPTRSGEGFVLEYVDDATVVASWFTHRPVGD